MCWCAAVCLTFAAGMSILVWISPEFARDFDSGARTANAGSNLVVAAVLLAVGAVTAFAALIRGGGYRVRAIAVLLLLLGCPAVAVLTLPLLDYYR